MKWKAKSIAKAPEEGDQRTRRKFAWLPTRIDNDERIWMESYLLHEEYGKEFRFFEGRVFVVWTWVTISKELAHVD